MRRFLLLASHGLALTLGFALGIYMLPILTAPASPDAAMLSEHAGAATHTAEFTRDLRGSDFLHWGEGTISLSPETIVHIGRLAPGPDYKVYLVPEFVDHEDGFGPLRERSVQVGDVKTFDGFILDMPDGIDIEAYTTVLIWCEAFDEFITAARYR